MIFEQLSQQLRSLNDLLSKLNDQQYNLTIKHLGNASIGGHTRHVIELLQCAIVGYENGQVDYENRKRNLVLETNKNAAQLELNLLLKQVAKEDKTLQIALGKMGCDEVSTTYFREILYNIEHVIHHLALIKVALIDMDLDLVGENFGMAYSTIKYKHALINN